MKIIFIISIVLLTSDLLSCRDHNVEFSLDLCEIDLQNTRVPAAVSIANTSTCVHACSTALQGLAVHVRTIVHVEYHSSSLVFRS